MHRAHVRACGFVAILLIAGCSASSKGARGDAPAEHSPTARSAPAGGIPTEAFELLAKSAADSCSICAKKLRAQAFVILEEQYPPGAIVMSDSVSSFLRVSGSSSELMRTSDGRGEPRLTFRFHTTADHLVGISDADITDDSVADRCRSAPEGALLQGALEIVTFEYGDGPTFLYHASSNRIQVQCRVLQIDAK